jgi:predicted O-methyltransferase YrrM
LGSSFSALWMAKALPDDGKLVTLELDPQVAKVRSREYALSHALCRSIGRSGEY